MKITNSTKHKKIKKKCILQKTVREALSKKLLTVNITPLEKKVLGFIHKCTACKVLEPIATSTW